MKHILKSKVKIDLKITTYSLNEENQNQQTVVQY